MVYMPEVTDTLIGLQMVFEPGAFAYVQQIGFGTCSGTQCLGRKHSSLLISISHLVSKMETENGLAYSIPDGLVYVGYVYPMAMLRLEAEDSYFPVAKVSKE